MPLATASARRHLVRAAGSLLFRQQPSTASCRRYSRTDVSHADGRRHVASCAVPDALRETVDQSSGLMVMSVVENGPAAQAGIVAGEIILSDDRTSTHQFRKIARYFGPERIDRKAELRVIRRGLVTVKTTIAERLMPERRGEQSGNSSPITRRHPRRDSPRRETLRPLVVEGGHIIVSDRDFADVISSDGDPPSSEVRPTVALGGADHKSLGLLPRDVNASK